MYKDEILKFAVPSDGALYESTLLFLQQCGLDVERESKRRYVGEIGFQEGIFVLFQRASDITAKVEEGNADIGILGHDRYLEIRKEDGPANVVFKNLGFGTCALEIGVPDSWVDVTAMADLADISMDFKKRGLNLKIATKFPRMVERFLLTNGISHFSLIESSGTLEVAPAMGVADIIADITASGTTMRENALKTINGGVILESEACLIVNSRTIESNKRKSQQAENFMQVIRSHLESESLLSKPVNNSQ